MPLDMKPDIRDQWCASLRSGDYTQVQEELRNSNGHCCLGVLTDLYVKAGNPAEVKSDWGGTVWDQDTILAAAVRDWAGLDSVDPYLTEHATAAHLNDAGRTFAEIADLIDGGAE